MIKIKYIAKYKIYLVLIALLLFTSCNKYHQNYKGDIKAHVIGFDNSTKSIVVLQKYIYSFEINRNSNQLTVYRRNFDNKFTLKIYKYLDSLKDQQLKNGRKAMSYFKVSIYNGEDYKEIDLNMCPSRLIRYKNEIDSSKIGEKITINISKMNQEKYLKYINVMQFLQSKPDSLIIIDDLFTK
jgi:hypothetical protein